MKKTTLTPTQHKTLEYIKSYIAKNGQSPTMTEIREKFGLDSLRSVAQRIESLEAKGFIKRDRFQHRSIRVLNSDPNSPNGTLQIPVIASAGCDAAEVYAQEQYDEFLNVDKTLISGGKDIVAVKALGNSMLDAGIHNGDYVLVEVTDNVSNDDRVVVILGDMAVIKRIHTSPIATVLHPESDGNGYSPIVVSNENTKIFGKVLSVIPMSSSDDDYQFIYEPGMKPR